MHLIKNIQAFQVKNLSISDPKVLVFPCRNFLCIIKHIYRCIVLLKRQM